MILARDPGNGVRFGHGKGSVMIKRLMFLLPYSPCAFWA